MLHHNTLGVSIPNPANLNSNLSSGNSFADVERGRICDLDTTARECGGLDLAEGEREGLGNLADRFNTRLFRSRGSGRSSAGENPKLASGDVIKDGNVQPEILGEDFLGNLSIPDKGYQN